MGSYQAINTKGLNLHGHGHKLGHGHLYHDPRRGIGRDEKAKVVDGSRPGIVAAGEGQVGPDAEDGGVA